MPDETPSDPPFNPFGEPGLTPWEDPDRGWLSRLFGTLGLAFRPLSSLTRISEGPVRPALIFALLTAPPLALAGGIIPFTRTLNFGPGMAVTPTGQSSLSLPLDVLQAAGVGLLITTAQVLAFALPFASLVRAFAADAEQGLANAYQAAWRISLYRAWSLPAALLVGGLLAWVLPVEQGPVVGVTLMFTARLLLVLQYSAATRLVGAGPFAGLATTLIPLVVEALVSNALGHVLDIPRMEAPPGGEPGAVPEPPAG